MPSMVDRHRLLTPEELSYLREGFTSLLQVPGHLEPGLAAASRDLLDHPGSLARAQLAWAVTRAHGLAGDRARALAVAVEYFHTASLVFDDLPSMDDAEERRGRPCPHLAYGEGSAILAALGLITRAYALLWEAIGPLPEAGRVRAGAMVAECLGVAGILDGQARDLAFAAGPRDRAAVLDAASGKTVPLVRLALVLPALVAGAPPDTVDRLEELAESWGLAYQALDDFKDRWWGREETGKSTARDRLLGRPNLPLAVGPDQALLDVDAFLSRAADALGALGETTVWAPLARLHRFLCHDRDEMASRLRRCA